MSNRALAIGFGLLLAFGALAGAQTWTPLVHQPTFSASTALLLTDGTVMVQATESGIWWRLKPDNTGSYINGTWSQLASMPAGYGPLYYASAVLPDGRVVVEGGEYNNSGGPVWSSLGAIYNPASNTWNSIAPPAGWSNIGDAQSVVLANGTFMLANPFTTEAALLNASTLSWTPTGTGKTGRHDEEGWTLLPNGRVLTVDANNTANLTNSEAYDPATGIWSSAGSTIVKLPDTNADGSGSHEIGPAVLRPNGTVFATGGTSNTAIYNAIFGGWSAGPTFPNGLDAADAPAALLPNGNVLVDVSPGIFVPGAQFFEFNGANLIAVPRPPNAPNEPSFVGRMLVLPTGQILFTDSSFDVEVYTASGTYQSSWRPTINSFPSSVTLGTANYSISGWQFNGLSQGAIYGDDAQSATNYPLVRITNNATAHVSYARTHNHSTMAVATGSAIVSTQFDVPADIETGASTLQVVANGIPSSPVAIQVVALHDYAGTLDHAGCDTLLGWAADRNRLNTVITVSIYNNGNLLTTLQASGSRPDVGAFLGDNGLHGFGITTPASLLDGGTHQVSVRFENSSTELGGSPVSLTCVPPTARFNFTCSGLFCSFDGSGSTDDHGIASYAWTFGDSTSGSGVTTSHNYGTTGIYTVTLTVTDTDGLTSSTSTNVSVNSDQLPAAEGFFTVPRCRVLDTRSGTPLTSGQPQVVSIAGNCNIPSSAKALSLVVTAIQPTGGGYLGLYPGNLPSMTPNRASINFLPATSPRSNNAIVRLATDSSGTLGLKPTVSGTPGQLHVTIDVDGYFSEDTAAAVGAQGPFGFQAITPCRAVDTRPSSPLVSGVARTFSIKGVCGIPSSGVAAVSANTRVLSPTASGSIVLYRAGSPVPVATDVNFNGGIAWLYNGSRSTLATSLPDLGMRFDSATSGASAFVLFDVNGYFSSGGPLKYHPIAGCRAVDTRAAESGGPSVTAGSIRTYQIQGNCNIPVGAKAVFATVLAVGPTGTGDIRLYASNAPIPAVATVCFDAGESAVSNGTIVPLAPTIPDLGLQASPSTGTLDVIIDVFGYFD